MLDFLMVCLILTLQKISSSNSDVMKNDLTATKHELLKVRDMLEMAEKV